MPVLWLEMAYFYVGKSTSPPSRSHSLSGGSEHFLTTNLMQHDFLNKRLHNNLCLGHEEVQSYVGSCEIGRG